MHNESTRNSAAGPSLAEVIEVLRPHMEKVEEGFKAIRVTLDALAEHLGGRPVEAGGQAANSPMAPVADVSRPPASPAVAKKEAAPAAVPVEPAPATPPAPRAELPPTVSAGPPRAAATPAAIPVSGPGGNWSQIIFGDHLNADPSISHLSGSLLADVYAGDNDAIGMLGNLLTFRSATAERKPRLLKDLGEAFYLWKPRGDAPLRDGLIVWIHVLLDEAQIANRIEVVQVGDRYDMQRHNARERGVEVADVYGWVVLRENGKVYSKANVSVR
jgi:hypothetical protein